MKICLACEAEYTDWITTCSDCGTALVDSQSEDEPERVIYEVGAWPLALQASVAQAMAESGIPHTWIDTDLAIEEEYEEQVDAIMDEIEKASDLPETTRSTGDMSYELDEWTQEQRNELQHSLLANRIPHRWEGDILVVAIADEDTVDALLDQAEFSDHEDDMSPEIMSELFATADTLRRHPSDADAIESLGTHLPTMNSAFAPFGVDARVWKQVVTNANELADLIVDETASNEAIKERAGVLRDLLFSYV